MHWPCTCFPTGSRRATSEWVIHATATLERTTAPPDAPPVVDESSATTLDPDELYQRLRLLRDHGSVKKYHHEVVGFADRLDTLQAAVLAVKLTGLAAGNEARRALAAGYSEKLAGIGDLVLIPESAHRRSVFHLYVVRIDPGTAGGTRDDYQRALEEERIATSIHFLPVHMLSWYRARFRDECPVAERAGAQVLSLPLSPAHSDEDIGDACDALARVHARFTR